MEYDLAVDGSFHDSRGSDDDYDDTDRFAREYGDKKSSYRDFGEDDDDDEDGNEEEYERDSEEKSHRRRHQKEREAASESESENEEERRRGDDKKRKREGDKKGKESTVQDLIYHHLTTVETMFQLPLEYLGTLKKKFKRLVENKLTSLQFKEELNRMLEELDNEMEEAESGGDEEASQSDEEKSGFKFSKKRKRDNEDDHYNDKRGDDGNGRDSYRSGTKKVKIVDSEDRPVDLRDLASLGIKKPGTLVTQGRIVIGQTSSQESGAKGSVPLIPGRRDPVFKTKSYVPPKKL